MKPKILKEYYSTGELWLEEYYINGKYHREDGPAYVSYYEDGSIRYESYHINDKYHREDGPAWVGYYEDGSIKFEEYYINGKQLNKEEVEELKREKEINKYFQDLLEEA